MLNYRPIKKKTWKICDKTISLGLNRSIKAKLVADEDDVDNGLRIKHGEVIWTGVLKFHKTDDKN